MIKLKMSDDSRKTLLQINDLDSQCKEAIETGLRQFGESMVRTGENSALNEPKFGREYRLKSGGVRKIHRASKAGQSPAAITFNYVRNFKTETNGSESMEFGNDAGYAEFLEFGTDRMEPRPGVRNAVQDNFRNGHTFFEENLKGKLLSES